MFSEYASRVLTRPQRPAPLFQGSTGSLDSDTEAFLGWVDHSASSSEEDTPPDDIAIERPDASAAHDPLDPLADSTMDSSVGALGQQAPVRRPIVGTSGRLEQLTAAAYVLITSMTLAVATLVLFSTSPSSTIGVYPIFGKSTRTLGAITALSIAAAWVWLWSMRTNPKGMVQLNTFAVPVICVATSCYGFFGSFHSSMGHGLVHAAMRTTAGVPLLAAAGWVYVLRRDKNSVGRASEMITLALRVLDGPSLLLSVSIACGIASILFTFLWILFVSRAFLEGSLSVVLALLFSFTYFWTWALVCNMQRCLITLLCCYWLEDRVANDGWALAIEVAHRFGGCALSSLLSILGKAPAILVGRRLGRLAEWGVLALTPASALAILDPLTLTIAVTQRSSLTNAAQVVLSPEFNSVNRKTYSLAKMFLRATKVTFSLVVAFIGWVHADRVDSSASVYSYLIAIAAFAVGWTVFGTAENTVSMVLDGLLVNHALYPRSNNELQRIFDIY